MKVYFNCKCKNCGKYLSKLSLTEYNGTFEELIEEVTNYGYESLSRKYTHQCASNEVGLCEIIGFKVE